MYGNHSVPGDLSQLSGVDCILLFSVLGSEEDSRQNCLNLIPKPPKQDFQKFMEKDRQGLDSNVLRFMASLDTDKAIDLDRRFIVSYYLSDNTLSVYEPLVRNSGIIGGKFIERGKILKGEGLDSDTQRRVYYEPKDLYVGARVSFNRHNFLLIDADEYAISYMENRSGVLVIYIFNAVEFSY